MPDPTTIKHLLYLLVSIVGGLVSIYALRKMAKAKAQESMKAALDLESEADGLHEEVKRLAKDSAPLEDYKAHARRVQELMK